jgi:trans-2,3-dihydro-3-hydroxyanthranilate isomerase
VFVCAATQPDADLQLRYFTSTTEVDLCGHATIAAMFALAASGRVTEQSHGGSIRAQTRCGVLELGLEFLAGELTWVSMRQPMPSHQIPTHPELAATILGLEPSAIRHDLPIACANTGIWSCFVPLIDLDALASIVLKREQIEALWPDNTDFAGIYPFVLLDNVSPTGAARAQGRFFCPEKFGIKEDPVTGTASGALAAYLIRAGALSATDELQVQQGIEMGSPGSMRIRQLASGAIEIRGQAVAIFRGELTF